MECTCGGMLTEGRSSYSMSGEYYYIVIEDIPAYKCSRCGKILFQDDVVDKIKALLKRVDRDTKEIISGTPSVHTYDY